MANKPSPRVIIAGIVAATADMLQLVVIPGASLGVLNPINDILDFVVAGIMVSLLGWHWAFMPSIMGKLIPGIDLVPLWSMAVFIVGMGGQNPAGTPQQGPSMIPPAVPFPLPGSNAPQPQKELTVQAQPHVPESHHPASGVK